MHVLQWRLVVVAQSKLVLGLNQELICSAKVPKVVAECSHQQSILFQLACPFSGLSYLLQSEDGEAHIHGVLEAVIWHILHSGIRLRKSQQRQLREPLTL